MEQVNSMMWLLKHCRKLLRSGSFSNGRISRGEYWVSILLLSTTMALVGLVLWALSALSLQLPEGVLLNTIFTILTVLAWIILPLCVAFIQIKLVIKRSHDLDKSGRYAYSPMLVMLVCLLVAAAISRSSGLLSAVTPEEVMNLVATLKSNILLWIVCLLWLIALIWSIGRWIVVWFYKGTTDNQYGVDPLLHQPTGNSFYRSAWLLLVVINIIFSIFNNSLQTYMFGDESQYDMEWYDDSAYYDSWTLDEGDAIDPDLMLDDSGLGN